MWSIRTIFLIILFCQVNFLCLKGQSYNFVIDGTTNVDSGEIVLHFYRDYAPGNIDKVKAEIKNKKFSLEGYIDEPQGVFITIDDIYLSSQFIIDKGQQIITINTNLSQEVPKVENNTMLDEYSNYISFRETIDAKNKSFNQKKDSINKLYKGNLPDSVMLVLREEQKKIHNESDTTLLNYSELNPNSYIAFWNLVRLMDWGYEPIFDSIYNSFSETIRCGYAGNVLKSKLQSSCDLSVGNKFISFNCQTAYGKLFSPNIFIKNKFTLVDFWFSSCVPCRVQFSSMRNLYKKYSDKGFEIVGISVDQINAKKDLEDIIVQENLVWEQYWDVNGTESKRFSINAFPTNFLIDENCKIIFKNISMEELDEFLNSSL